jgi:hypothetical protein
MMTITKEQKKRCKIEIAYRYTSDRSIFLIGHHRIIIMYDKNRHTYILTSFIISNEIIYGK